MLIFLKSLKSEVFTSVWNSNYLSIFQLRTFNTINIINFFLDYDTMTIETWRPQAESKLNPQILKKKLALIIAPKCLSTSGGITSAVSRSFLLQNQPSEQSTISITECNLHMNSNWGLFTLGARHLATALSFNSRTLTLGFNCNCIGARKLYII